MPPGDSDTLLEKCHALLAQTLFESFLFFFKKVKRVESLNEKTFLKSKKSPCKEPFHFFRCKKREEDKTMKDTKKCFTSFLRLQTSRRRQKQ
jgi:hypothetical protein